MIFIFGSTAGVTTIEFEPGLVQDLPKCLEKVAPSIGRYKHDQKPGVRNGHSHVRAALIGPTITVPFLSGGLMLDAWQQIVVVDFDTKSRHRKLVIQLMGT